MISRILTFVLIGLSPLTMIGQTIGSMTDPRDGKIYQTVELNNQIWLFENMNYSKNAVYYDNNELNAKSYGALYSVEFAQNTCPNGWRLPSINDIIDLLKLYGGIPIKSDPYGGMYSYSFANVQFDNLIKDLNIQYGGMQNSYGGEFIDIGKEANIVLSNGSQLNPDCFHVLTFNKELREVRIELYADPYTYHKVSVRCIEN